jgi:hypothetical protein
VVIRVNNWKLEPQVKNAGRRVDIWYSFFGSSIRVKREAAIEAGVRLCVAKCPDAAFVRSNWHIQRRKTRGTDFRYIYKDRAEWWFCPVAVPTREQFMRRFDMLKKHVPTTGFAAILDVLDAKPASLYLTGFDFFSSGLHNVNERWRKGDPRDPIGHVPHNEAAWLRAHLAEYPITMDERLERMMRAKK